LIFRALKRLENAISLSVVHWLMGKEGWTFDEGAALFRIRSLGRVACMRSISAPIRPTPGGLACLCFGTSSAT
jgi:glutathionyl-hydroquinone reductase